MAPRTVEPRSIEPRLVVGFDRLLTMSGADLGATDWLEITQDRVDRPPHGSTAVSRRTHPLQLRDCASSASFRGPIAQRLGAVGFGGATPSAVGRSAGSRRWNAGRARPELCR